MRDMDDSFEFQIFVDRLSQGDGVALFMVVSVFSILAACFSLFMQWRVYRWPYVWGQLLDADTAKFGYTDPIPHEQEYHNKVSYSYVVNGQTYKGHRLSAMVVVASHNLQTILSTQLAGINTEDGKVKVFYNPRNPQKSYLIKGSVIQLAFTVVFAAIMAAVLYTLIPRY